MAEPAPLISAHTHARKAGQETASAHWSAAVGEHKQAADDFRRASRTTSDSEALRILNLLEQQHRELARIISTHDAGFESPKTQSPDQGGKSSSATPPQKTTAESPELVKSSSTARASTSAKRLNPAIRDSSPSLAREMASRRGIPPVRAQASSLAQSATHEPVRRSTIPTPRIPSSVMDVQSQPVQQDLSNDDGFASFYSNLTTGTMSKLSSVLAFAGLPLAPEEPKDESPASRLRTRTVKANADPDVKKIFSNAALTAIEEEHKQRGLQGQAFGPSESFYVVQTAGGTLSYADIAKAQAQQHDSLGGDDEESFVDAREAQPSSPRHGRSASTPQHPRRSDFGTAHRGEELELENTTLKQTLEQLASRLANFEAHAQDASMAALTQSMATVRPGAPASADAGPHERIKLLEKRIEQQAEQREKLEELARKQEKKIRAYHSKWEEIKKSAREKDKVKRGDVTGSPG